jgi:cell division protein FtsW (lipid II flippase)
VAGTLAVLIALSRPSRVQRILSFFQPHTADPMSDGYQIQQGTFALANGGIFGVGLGNSRSKWSWLPASSTDFIFAITGEELGLIGAVLVLGLFVILAFSFCRIMTASTDPFARVVTGTVLVWILGQGLVNIAVVLGLLPVLGVPLPLISAGGTALISTLLAIGVVLSFARHQNAPR